MIFRDISDAPSPEADDLQVFICNELGRVAARYVSIDGEWVPAFPVIPPQPLDFTNPISRE